MFSYTTKSGRLTLKEGCNGYYVTDNDSNTTVGCGDGTQWVSPDDAELTDAESTELRNDRAVDDIEGNQTEWLEAYFGK